MTELVLTSPAKLNLFLHITDQRSDGYHELQTLFQLLDVGDQMRFSATSDGLITLDSVLEGVPQDQNLVFRAAQLLKPFAQKDNGALIHLDKKLPMGGGLGGGSSNAATTLLALNQLWQLNFPINKLAALGATLGADVPVFVEGKTAWAEGIGEKLSPVQMPKFWYLVLIPGCRIKTHEVFCHPDLTRNTDPIKIRAFLEQGGRNDCQKVAELLYPEVREARVWLSQYQPACLTGTGACLFAQFESKGQAESINQCIPTKWRGFVARGVNRSPVHKTLDV